MRSKNANEFLERNRICDEVLITEAVAAVNIAEDDFMARVADAWDAMSEAMRFDITTVAMIKAKEVFMKKLMKDEDDIDFTEEELLTIENFRKSIDEMSDEHHAFISDLYKKNTR